MMVDGAVAHPTYEGLRVDSQSFSPSKLRLLGGPDSVWSI